MRAFRSQLTGLRRTQIVVSGLAAGSVTPATTTPSSMSPMIMMDSKRSYKNIGSTVGMHQMFGADAEAAPEQTKFKGTKDVFGLKGSLDSPENKRIDSPEQYEDFKVKARLAHQTGSHAQALALYGMCLQYVRWDERTKGAVSEEAAFLCGQLGRVYIDSRLYPEAENHLTEACALWEAKQGNKSLKYADALSLLALCYREIGAYKQSEDAFRESLAIFQDKKHGIYNPDEGDFIKRWLPAKGVQLTPEQEGILPSIAHVVSDLSTLLASLGKDHEESYQLLEQAVAIRRYLYSDNIKFKSMIAKGLVQLSELVRGYKRDPKRALSLAEEAVKICAATQGRDSAATAGSLSSCGSCHLDLGDTLAAMKCYEEASVTFALAFGKDNPLVGVEMLKLVQAMVNRYETAGLESVEGRKLLDSAEKKVIRGMEIVRAKSGNDNQYIATGNKLLAQVLKFKNELNRSITALREAVKIRQTMHSKSPLKTPDAELPALLESLGTSLAAMRDPEAESHLLAAADGYRQFKKIDPTQEGIREAQVSTILATLASHYRNFHLDKQALQAWREVIDIRTKWLPPGQNRCIQIAVAESGLSSTLDDLQDFEESLRVANSALKNLEEAGVRDSPLAADALTIKAASLYKRNMFEEALPVLKEELALLEAEEKIAKGRTDMPTHIRLVVQILNCLLRIGAIHLELGAGKSGERVEEALHCVNAAFSRTQDLPTDAQTSDPRLAEVLGGIQELNQKCNDVLRQVEAQ